MNIYKPTIAGLDFWIQVSSGGMIFAYDFINPGFMGINESVVSFEKNYSIVYAKVQKK